VLAIFVLDSFAMTTRPISAQTIVAHRGASYDAPENTLSAFRLALEQGADGIEGDFYVTRDNQVVCLHDKDTKRTAGKKLDVAKSTLAELRSLDYGVWKGPKFAGEPIPTFDEVLNLLPPGKLFVIELKTGPEIVPLIKKRLEADSKNRKDSDFLFISFHADTIAKCKELLPSIRAHWLTGFKTDKQTGVCTPDAATICRTVEEIGADGVGMQGNRQQVGQEFVSDLKTGGCREFHVWTIDEPADARYFQKLGAVGITTNRPQLIRESLGN
jgi:glycerophosphoryl diester phosphodiesterase